MADTTRTETYRRVRRWVDNDLATQHRPLSIFGPLFLILFAMFGAHWAGSFAEVISWAVFAPLCLVWTAFVGWRIVRLVRTASIRGDREYDQKGKFLLPPEYRTSESYLAHQKRQKRRRLLRRR